MRRRHNERGFMATEWVAAMGLLLIPTFVLVMSATRVPEAQAGAQTIATEAARAGAQAASCAEAYKAADEAATRLGPDLNVKLKSIDQTDTVWKAGGGYTVHAHVAAPVVVLPGFIEFKGITLDASHTEPIDQYRFIDETACG
jgi:hypothetical protein